MRIHCPECQHALKLKAVQPGRYQPRCKQCGRSFQLIVRAGSPPSIQVARLADDDPATVPDAPSGNPPAGSEQAAAGQPRDRAAPPPPPRDPQRVEPLEPPEPPEASLPPQLGGYRIVRLIGRGAMGAVYEARQVSLDRTVALKTILTRWANEPASLARFTREAYAAAQLTHHNIVQIYDFGNEHGTHYFSMEWVRGGSLSELVRKQGALEPRVAAGYILQAARGLQFAHRHGMIHRDVKPANLLLSQDGVVKVADLGLVKLPDQVDPQDDVLEDSARQSLGSGLSGHRTEVTLAGSTVGTPAYMPPEQALDAASVDHRADIYSLGCSLYHLLAGKPPFGGADINQVLALHQNATPVPLIRINPRVPDALVRITQRAMAKHVDDRYENIGQMVEDLQSLLGLHSDQPFSPDLKQVERLERCVADFHRSPIARLRTPLTLALSAAAALLAVLLPLISFRWILFTPLLIAATLAGYFIAAGLLGNSPLYRRLVQWGATLRWQQWLLALLGGSVLLTAVVLSGSWPLALIAVLLGSVLGTSFFAAIDWQLSRQRQPAIAAAEQLLRDLRISGVDENKLRAFIARYAGKHWEAFFESLFGYEAMRQSRRLLQSSGEMPAGSGRWPLRDWVFDWLGARIEAGREQRDRRRLAELEQQSLQASGMNAAQAEAQAWRMAAAMVEASRVERHSQHDAEAARAIKRARTKAMLADARSGVYQRPRRRLLTRILGPLPRFVIGCLLLLVFSFWAYQNDLLSRASMRAVVDQLPADVLPEAVVPEGLLPADELSGAEVAPGDDAAPAQRQLQPLPLVGPLLSPYAAAVAGLLLVLASGVSAWQMSLFAYPAALLALFGEALGIPAIGPLAPWAVAAGSAAALFVAGVFLSYDREAEYGP